MGNRPRTGRRLPRGRNQGDGVLPQFDSGFYSREPHQNPRGEYVVLYEDIGGYRAKLVLPAYPPATPATPAPGYAALIAVFFYDLPSPPPPMDTRLKIYGASLTEDQQEIVTAILRSLALTIGPFEEIQWPATAHILGQALTTARAAAEQYLGLPSGEDQVLALELFEEVQWPTVALRWAGVMTMADTRDAVCPANGTRGNTVRPDTLRRARRPAGPLRRYARRTERAAHVRTRYNAPRATPAGRRDPELPP